MRVASSLFMAGLFVVAVAACSKNSQEPEGTPLVTRPDEGTPPPAGQTESGPTKGPTKLPDLPPPTTATPAATTDAGALQVFVARCSSCHGRGGAGDGMMASAFPVKPRSFVDAAWQASVTDEQISAIIIGGSASVGKSPIMPASPDLANQPDVVRNLIDVVRSFNPSK